MPPEPHSTLRLDIDVDALVRNWRTLDRMSGSAKAGAAVKADAYGVGVDTAVPALRDAGCKAFFVAHSSEAATVCAHVPPDRVAVLHGPATADDVSAMRAIGALPVINSISQAARWSVGGGGPCHLMIDTGINRLGIAMSEIGDPAIAALEVSTVLSHLASADEDSTQNLQQLALAREAFVHFPDAAKSLANSAGIALGPQYHFDLTRPGLSLYGGKPRQELTAHIAQVVRPRAAIMQTRTIGAGDSVGYNGTFTATEPTRTGIVSLGYADGFLRCWSGAGTLLHDGRSLPLLGRVSMDMVVVDLTAAPELGEGDWLEIPYDLPEASKMSGLSQYELLTILGNRFAR